MLTELRIKNFAIIEALTLPLAPGFNVLSGETGAGKSIIVDALGLLLGERANADVIRTGTDRASVEGVFDIADRPEIKTLLDDRGIDVEDNVVVLKREVAPGRARAWINGTVVNASGLAEAGRLLVNLHGQHEAQTLLDPEAQRRILDAFAGATDKAAEVRDSYEELLVTIDGQVGTTFAAGETLSVRRTPGSVQIVRFPGTSFFTTLRQKLGWGGLADRDKA